MLSIVNSDDSEKWDSIVMSFQNYDVYYLSSYTKAFKIHGDGEPILIYYQDEELRAINVVMMRDIAMDKDFKNNLEMNMYFDITTPYGYGGFLIEGNINEVNLEKLNEEYTNYCYTKNIVSEFVRYHPILDNAKTNNSIFEVTQLGKTITMELDSKNQIWNDLSGKNRNVIRKAIKSGVEIYWGRNPELIDSFIPLYNETMSKDHATDYYYFKEEFYESILKDLKHNNLIFYAVYNQKIISMSMILFSNGNMHYHLSASDRKYQNLAATNLLLYEAACWGCENGYKKFHLGGGLGSKEDSLFKFKKAFNKNSDTYFSIGKKIFNQDKYDELVRMIQDESKDKNSQYFPQYRK